MLVLGGGGNLQCGGYWKVTSGNLIEMVSNSYLHMYTLHVSLTGNGEPVNNSGRFNHICLLQLLHPFPVPHCSNDPLQYYVSLS